MRFSAAWDMGFSLAAPLAFVFVFAVVDLPCQVQCSFLPPRKQASDMALQLLRRGLLLSSLRASPVAAIPRFKLATARLTTSASTAPHHNHQAARIKRRKDTGPFSVFGSRTSQWKDLVRAQGRERRERELRSPFVQRRYELFVRMFPEIRHCGLAKAPKSPQQQRQQRRQAAFSYLQARLLKKNRPKASARSNSLLRLQRRTQPLQALLRTRTRRQRRPTLFSPHAVRVSQAQAREAMAAAWRERRAPEAKKSLAKRVSRYLHDRVQPGQPAQSC